LRRGDYTISTDPALVDIDVVHAFLARSYWAAGVSRDVVERSVAGSLVFGVYRGVGQVGFARVITDFATTAYLADVFVLEAHRGRGLAAWLMETIHAHPRLQGLRVWRLATKDAHALYEKAGWRRVAHPERLMEIIDPLVYAGEAEGSARREDARGHR
jgi:GNAT superfamily N-acetyltransferase